MIQLSQFSQCSIDLEHPAIVFQTQVVDHDAVFVRPAIEVDVVGGFAFALHACAHEFQFPFDERLFVWRHAGVGKPGGEFGKVDAFGVGFFQDHGQGAICIHYRQALIVRLHFSNVSD